MIYTSCRLHPIEVSPEKKEKYFLGCRHDQSNIDFQRHKLRLPPESWRTLPYGREELVARYPHVDFSLPLVVEFCSGTGEFLIEAARHYPQYLFIGVEIALPCIQRALRQIDVPFHNLLFYHGGGNDFISHDFRDFPFEMMMVNFPDPWLKKRHIKRRIISDDFLQACKKSLIHGGSFFTATDVEILYLYHREMIDPVFTPIEKAGKLGTKNSHDQMDLYRFSSRYQKKNLAGSQQVFYTHHLHLEVR